MDGRDGVLARFGVREQDKLGEGGESEVFTLDAHQVLRVHKQEAAAYSRAIGELYAGLDPRSAPVRRRRRCVPSAGAARWVVRGLRRALHQGAAAH